MYVSLKLSLQENGKRFRATLQHETKADPPPVDFDFDLDAVGEDGRPLRTIFNKIRDLTAVRVDLERAGSLLFTVVFSGGLGGRFQSWYEDLGADEKIRLRLDIQTPALQELPWELLMDEKQFLARRGISIVRFGGNAVKADVEVQNPNVLVVSASPAGRLSFPEDEYVGPIVDTFSKAQVAVQVVRGRECTRARLQGLLFESKFDLVHFVGHGQFKGGIGELVILDEAGGPEPITGSDFADFLKAASVKFAFLSSCKTAQTSAQNTFRGVAQSLIASGVPAVVAMQYDFPQKEAKTFVESFYKRLLIRQSIDEAMHYARQALKYDDVAWCIPTLYSQFDVGTLVAASERRDAADPPPPPIQILNPFLQFGSPQPDRFCGQAGTIHDMIDLVLQRDNGLIVGDRRMGKTSVLLYMTHEGTMQAHGLSPEKHLHIFYDASAQRDVSFDAFWKDLFLNLGRKLAPDERKVPEAIRGASRVQPAAIRRCLAQIRKSHEVAFFIDESDVLLSSRLLSGDFFHFLSDLNDGEGIMFILSTRYRPSQYIRQGNVAAQPFFDTCRVKELRPLERGVWPEFVQRYAAGEAESFRATDGQVLERLSGFYPYYLLVACATIFDERKRGTRRDAALDQFWQQVSGSLADHWTSSDERERLMMAVLALRGQGPGHGPRVSKHAVETYCPSFQATLEGLRQRGLVEETEDRVALFSKSLEAWILGYLVDGAGDGTGTLAFPDWYVGEFGHNLEDDFDPEHRGRLAALFSRVNSANWELFGRWCRQARYRDHAISLLSMLPTAGFSPSQYLAAVA
jgi:hypothetical protein